MESGEERGDGEGNGSSTSFVHLEPGKKKILTWPRLFQQNIDGFVIRIS